jgi:predicted DNA-binding transcriptional regulator AlpA
MGRRVDVDDLIDTQAVAELLGLAHRNTVSEYQARYNDMPRPAVDLGRGRSKLWLQSEVAPWAAMHRARAGSRGRRRSANPS